MRLPIEIWRDIFAFDSTFHQIFQGKVLPELRRYHTESMAEIFFHFFWDENYVRSVTYDQDMFHFTTICYRKYTVEYLKDDHVKITFRIHNHHTGTWYDQVL